MASVHDQTGYTGTVVGGLTLQLGLRVCVCVCGFLQVYSSELTTVVNAGVFVFLCAPVLGGVQVEPHLGHSPTHDPEKDYAAKT